MEWTITDNKLTREFECENFMSAVQFLNQIAIMAEKADHHPDILLCQYKKIKVILFTHNEFAITGKDYMLARQIDEAFTGMLRIK